MAASLAFANANATVCSNYTAFLMGLRRWITTSIRNSMKRLQFEDTKIRWYKSVYKLSSFTLCKRNY
jgi:hypothetical protein